MPIVIPKDIPAFDVLTRENIFVMGSMRARTQDIRPIEIAIVNLMPTKIETETQLMRMLSNSPLQVNITLVRTASYTATNVSSNYMERFYLTFDDIKAALQDALQPVGLLRSYKRGEKRFTRTQPMPFGKHLLHSLMSYKICVLYSFLHVVRGKIAKHKMTELHS